ncbi:MAG: HTH domain-containing protein [Oscillospiraceae bacterium]|nr:HTH domain-containing protein [Oscillospiraceae bacterium]MCC8156295.1 HTH domain-containing protein [Oscillospiraceae bacterium]MCD7852702.1 HTH domain-containing protein [Oscillospiraceae bacterium]MCD7861900.1 HTH domain-containing protein [Oscillospiraceae bacterium]MCD8128936.1 HTH domain-containing protein [Oscillospiraceae bacterium]
MDDTLWRTLLFDYYGDLLTERQQECYDLYYNSDLSLQEIADNCGISRQGVWEQIHRAEKALQRFEARTGQVARALRRRETLQRLAAVAERLADSPEKREILAGLQELSD